MHDVVQRSRRPSFVCSRGERDRDKGDKSVRGGREDRVCECVVAAVSLRTAGMERFNRGNILVLGVMDFRGGRPRV